MQYYATDHLGSTNFTFDSVGNVLSHTEYFPSGEIWRSETLASHSGINQYQFTGKEWDDVTGLYDFGYRSYDPVVGQWLSPDPAFDGLNLYAYVHNNSVNKIDPFGLSDEYSRANPIPVAGATSNGKPIAEGDVFFQADDVSESGRQGAADFDRTSANSPVYRSENKGLTPGIAKTIGQAGAETRDAAAGMENGGLGPVDTALQAGMMAGAAATGSDIRTDGTGSPMGVPGGQCMSCSGGRAWQAAFIGLTVGATIAGSAWQGYRALQATAFPYRIVSSWADVGTAPDLASGRWVQLGWPTRMNYHLTGLSGPKWLKPYWNLSFQGPRSAAWNSVTDAVPRSSLEWPSGGPMGIERLKGLYGQRKLR